jgi:putative Mn2+ efflux pump MntP
MNFISTLALSLAMSTDAFAAAIGKGAALQKPQWREALRTGLIFGVIEGITPVIGWALGNAAAPYVEAWDHWIAFGLLAALGSHMVYQGFSSDAPEEHRPASHGFWTLALTGLATSIDAMAVGASLAFLGEPILVTAAAIGFSTFVMVTIGVMVGRVLGAIAGKRAEVAGGFVLIVIGALILYEHIGKALA